MLRPALLIAALAFTGNAALAEPVAPASMGASNLNAFTAQSPAPTAVPPVAAQTQAAAPLPPARPAVAKKRVAKKVVRPAPVQVVQAPIMPVQNRVAYRAVQFPSVGTGF